MNLLVDAHVFDHAHEGSRTYIYELYRRVVKLNPDITFYFVSYDPIPVENLTKEDNAIHVKLNSQNKYVRLLWEFPKIIKNRKIDFAHFQYISPWLKTCKEIVTIHDILFLDFPQYFSLRYRLVNGFLFKRSALRSELLLTVSQYSKYALSSHYGISLSKIHITPNAVALDNNLSGVSSEIEVLIKDKYILYVSRIEPRKNHIVLLQAFFNSIAASKDYKLIFVGRKDIEVPQLNQYLSNLSPKNLEKIIWLNNISNSDLSTIYKNAELFVYPSLAEGFGIPPLEAAIHEIPVLCANVTAMKDYSFFGEGLFDPSNVDELSSKINTIIEKGRDLKSLKLIKLKVLELYSWDRSAQIFGQLINEKFISYDV